MVIETSKKVLWSVGVIINSGLGTLSQLSEIDFFERVNACKNPTALGCQGILQHFYAVIISTHVCVIIGLQPSLKPE